MAPKPKKMSAMHRLVELAAGALGQEQAELRRRGHRIGPGKFGLYAIHRDIKKRRKRMKHKP